MDELAAACEEYLASIIFHAEAPTIMAAEERRSDAHLRLAKAVGKRHGDERLNDTIYNLDTSIGLTDGAILRIHQDKRRLMHYARGLAKLLRPATTDED